MMQYRVLWMEMIAGEEIPFSGRVYDSPEPACDEATAKALADSGAYRGIMIESRPASDEPWLRPWELEEMNT